MLYLSSALTANKSWSVNAAAWALSLKALRMVSYLALYSVALVVKRASSPSDDPKQLRLIRLTNKGLSLDEAKEVAQRLDLRTQGDDRILCYECHHLKGYVGLWRCSNWRKAGIAIREAGAGLGDMVNLFQRCNGFN